MLCAPDVAVYRLHIHALHGVAVRVSMLFGALCSCVALGFTCGTVCLTVMYWHCVLLELVSVRLVGSSSAGCMVHTMSCAYCCVPCMVHGA